MTRRPVSLSRRMADRARDGAPEPDPVGSLSGILEGLQGLVQGLKSADPAATPRMMVGWSVRTLDGAVSSFGNLPAGATSAAAPQARAPLVDVFEEPDAILVVAEVPGLDPDQLRLSLDGQTLLIEGGGRVAYRREVKLPGPVGAMTQACRNGILEIRLERAA
jgi:HSP20 family protein